jgi:hypothetical protein
MCLRMLLWCLHSLFYVAVLMRCFLFVWRILGHVFEVVFMVLAPLIFSRGVLVRFFSVLGLLILGNVVKVVFDDACTTSFVMWLFNVMINSFCW